MTKTKTKIEQILDNMDKSREGKNKYRMRFIRKIDPIDDEENRIYKEREEVWGITNIRGEIIKRTAYKITIR